MVQGVIHYGIHFIGPLIVALLFFRKNWKKAFAIMLLCMLIDLDHLLANPMFDPNRCSINFHLLHSYYAIALYVLLTCAKSTRLIGLGLLTHILADTVDCSFMLL